jgi:spermidine synthase/MFS family permease
LRALPYVAFFLSGTSSLIFQVIWTRMLHHVFGATSVAVSSVVTAFMIGLGLGAFLVGRLADRIKHPIITYALAELIVGVWAFALPYLVAPEGWLAGVNQALRQSLGAESLGFALGRFACVLPLLLVPTTLMGATLPLLARHYVREEEHRTGTTSAQVGTLYAVNTFGAVAGTFGAGFVLLPILGLFATNLIALSLNLLLALGIWLLRRPLLGERWQPGEPLRFWPESRKTGSPTPAAPSPPGPRDRPVDPPPFPAAARWAAFAAFAVSGATALAYEVVWTRALAMVIGSSTYSFSLILMTFLTGVAGGSAFVAATSGGAGVRRALGATGLYAAVLSLLASLVWAVERELATFAGAAVLGMAPILVVFLAVRSRGTGDLSLSGEPGPFDATPEERAVDPRPGLAMLAVPVVIAILNAALVEGTLPDIVAAVVTLLAAFAAGVLWLGRRAPVLFLAVIQLFVAVAAFTNYLFQDEIPFAFAQMVASLGDELPEQVGTVQGMMFATAGLCILPVTLGTGAMFPATLRVWSRGGARVGREVGVVYAGNTGGSILGAWLPGFLLMPMLGMERTLHLAIGLNLALCLLLLVVSGADGEEREADPDEAEPDEADPDLASPPERRVPFWHAATVYTLAPAIPALIALLVVGTTRGGLGGMDLRWNLGHMTLGVFRMSMTDDVLDPDSWGQPELPYYRDGLATTVTVEKWGRHLALKNNGKVDASNGDDMPTQIMVAGFPLLLHPDGPDDLDVAVVGFGSGVTVGTALQFPVARVDVLELEPRILEASRLFQDVNHLDYPLDEFPWVEMDRLHVHNDDGRNYLSSTDRRYDVIVSEPSNPWIAGVADLFTTDHFRITKKRLRDGGIYCQWVQLYELSPANIKTIYRTFASQFEHAMVFSAEDLSSDTVMIGSDQPIRLDVARMAAVFDRPAVAGELARAYVRSPYDVLARTLLASKDEILAYARVEHRRRGGRWVPFPESDNDPATPCEAPDCYRQPVPLNTDDNARIEFAAPRDLIGYARFAGYLDTVYGSGWPWGHLEGRLDGLDRRDGVSPADAYAELALALVAHGRKERADAFLARAVDVGPSETTLVAAEVLSLLLSDEHEPTVAIEPPAPGPEMDPGNRRVLLEGFQEVKDHVDARRWEEGLLAMEAIPAPLRLHAGAGMRLLYAWLLYQAAPAVPGRYGESIDQLEELARYEDDYVQRHPEIHYFLARAHDAEGQFDQALDHMRTFVEAVGLGDPARAGGDGVPPAGAAPTSDEAGESPKAEHPERS